MTHRILIRTALAAATLALTCGCTGSDEPATPSAPAVTEQPAGEIQPVPELAKGWKGVRNDVKVIDCPTEAGEVTAKGTVVNSASKARDITIVISWNAPDSTDPLLQLAVTKKAVPAGETAKWQMSGDLPAKAGECVVMARSGSLAKS